MNHDCSVGDMKLGDGGYCLCAEIGLKWSLSCENMTNNGDSVYSFDLQKRVGDNLYEQFSRQFVEHFPQRLTYYLSGHFI